MISSKRTKAIVKTVYQYFYGYFSAVERGEIADSILYQTLDLFFEILYRFTQNSSPGPHYSCAWRSSEINGWFCRDCDKAFISYSAVPTVSRSSNTSPLPDTFSTLFLFRDNFDGEVFLEKPTVKDGADRKRVHHVLSCTFMTGGIIPDQKTMQTTFRKTKDRSSRRIKYYCFRQGSIYDSKIIFRSATTFSSAPYALKNF